RAFRRWLETNRSRPKSVRIQAAAVMSEWLTPKLPASKAFRSTAPRLRRNRCRTILTLTGGRRSTTPMANRAVEPNSSWISPSAPAAKTLLAGSDLCQSSNHSPLSYMKKILLTLVILGAAVCLTRADTLVIKGSDTLGAKLVPQLAEEFKAQHPGTTF